MVCEHDSQCTGPGLGERDQSLLTKQTTPAPASFSTCREMQGKGEDGDIAVVGSWMARVWGVALAQQMQLAAQTWGGTSQPSKIYGQTGAVTCLKSAHLHGHMGRSSQGLQHRSYSHCWVWDAEGRKGTGGREASQPQHSPTAPSASLHIPAQQAGHSHLLITITSPTAAFYAVVLHITYW